MSPIRGQSSITKLAVPSDPILVSTTSSMTLTSRWLIYLRCMATGSVTVTTPRKSVSVCRRFLQHGVLSPQRTFWKAALTPEKLVAPPPGTLTSSCTVSYKLTSLRIFPPVSKIFPNWPCCGGRQRLNRFTQGSVPRGPHSNGAVFLSFIL